MSSPAYTTNGRPNHHIRRPMTYKCYCDQQCCGSDDESYIDLCKMAMPRYCFAVGCYSPAKFRYDGDLTYILLCEKHAANHELVIWRHRFTIWQATRDFLPELRSIIISFYLHVN